MLSFLYTRAFLNAYGLWLSQKPSTLVSFLREKKALPIIYRIAKTNVAALKYLTPPLKRSHWLAHLKSLLQKA